MAVSFFQEKKRSSKAPGLRKQQEEADRSTMGRMGWGKGMPGRKEGFPGCGHRESYGNREPPVQLNKQAAAAHTDGEKPGASSELCCSKYKDFRKRV